MKKNTSTHISRPKALLLMALLVILSPATLRAQETTTVQIGNGYNTYTSQYRSITFPESDTDDGEPYDGRNDIQIHIHIMNDIQPWSGEGTEQDPYIISSTENWNYFCNCLQDNATYNRFIGKTVRLANDIEVTRMAGSSTHDFMGTFDGQGHTLTITYGTAENPITEEYAAPFRNVENGCVIENLHVVGTITTANKYAAGIIAQQFGAVTIRNCRSSVTILSSVEGDGTHGGLVGVKGNSNNANLTIEGCMFDGKIVSTGTTATTNCGGFVGWRSNSGSITITNSLYAPTADNNAVSSGATFARNWTMPDDANCYYTETLGVAQGKLAHSITSEDVSPAFAGEANEYEVSGITSYGTGVALTHRPPLPEGEGEVLIAGDGDEVCLTFPVPEGFLIIAATYTPESGTATELTPVNGVYTFTMPDANVVIDAMIVGVYTFPWMEDFESYDENTTPIGWDNSASTAEMWSPLPFWIVYSYNENQMLIMNNRIIKQEGSALINSPSIVLPSEGTWELKFDYSHKASCGPLTVRISTDNGATFVDLASFGKANSPISYVDPGEFTEAFIPLTQYAGQTIIIQFYANVDTWTLGTIFVDNIEIYSPSPCRTPYGLDASNITTQTAELNWNGVQDSYNVRYRKNDMVFYESFENYTNEEELEATWTILDLGSGNNIDELGLYDGAALTGSQSFRFSSYHGVSYDSFDQYLISPMLDNTGWLEFSYKGANINGEKFRVGYSTTTNDVAAFSWSEIILSSDTWQTYLEMMPENTKYFAINYTSVFLYRLYIDDIIIYERNNHEWKYETNVTSLLPIDDLEPSALYECQVQGINANCEDGLTDWSQTSTFTTPILPVFTKNPTAYTENGGWHLIASPVDSVNPSKVTGMTHDIFDLYWFNQSAEGDEANASYEWRNYKQDAFNMAVGQGYLYAHDTNITLIFKGVPYRGDGSFPLVYDEEARFPGWNLVGNPFADTAYLADGRPFYTMNEEGSDIIVAEVNRIAPMEGVFVVANNNGETLTFTTQAPIPPSQKGECIVLNLSQGPSIVDRAIIRFGEDRTLPKFQINNHNTRIYIPQDGKDYAMVNLGRDDVHIVSTEIPIHFKASENGEYTLTVSTTPHSSLLTPHSSLNRQPHRHRHQPPRHPELHLRGQDHGRCLTVQAGVPNKQMIARQQSTTQKYYVKIQITSFSRSLAVRTQRHRPRRPRNA